MATVPDPGYSLLTVSERIADSYVQTERHFFVDSPTISVPSCSTRSLGTSHHCGLKKKNLHLFLSSGVFVLVLLLTVQWCTTNVL